jgi:hypothetical protein
MSSKIDITGADLRAVIQAAYKLSEPQGMGFLHAKPGPLTEAEVDAILARGTPAHPVNMDYINGRACKFYVQVSEGVTQIASRWYDHTDDDTAALLKAIGTPAAATA